MNITTTRTVAIDAARTVARATGADPWSADGPRPVWLELSRKSELVELTEMAHTFLQSVSDRMHGMSDEERKSVVSDLAVWADGSTSGAFAGFMAMAASEYVRADLHRMGV